MQWEGILDNLKDFISGACLVKTGSQQLVDDMKPYNTSIVIHPYVFDFDLIAEKRSSRLNKKETVIGYAGSLAHGSDLQQISGALTDIAHKYGSRVRFEFYGAKPDGTDRMDAELLERSSFVPYQPNYSSFIQDVSGRCWDIALAPLADNIANRSKTNNKYRECVYLCYLFLDDNYITLSEDEEADAYVKQIGNELRSENSRIYRGILTATPSLKDYFIKNAIHENVFLLEPVLKKAAERSRETESLTLAYMGGGFRDKVFMEVVLPAIKRLGKNRRIRLVCPNRLNLKGLKEYKDIEIVQLEFNLALEEVLRIYGEYHPHILIHCGPKIENNKYKNENGLMNAVQLGAVFAPSKEYPYIKYDGKYYVCSDNTPDAWYETLNELAENAEKRKAVFDAAKDYCLSRHSTENTIAELNEILDEIESASSSQLIQRLTIAINNSVSSGTQPTTDSQLSTTDSQGGRASRSLVGRCIVYSGGIKKKRVYRVVCTKESFSQVGICFAFSGPTTGSVRVSVTYNGECLGVANLSFANCVHDFWTYIDIASKGNMLNKLLEIALEYTYETNHGQAGVAEDGEKITLPVKVLRKLNLTRTITDLLFTDFR